MIVLNLTEQEARALISLIDLAVKSGGLGVAEAGVVLALKIKAELEKKPENGPPA